MAERTAILHGFDNVPALDTGAPLELQFAVDLGAICADAWLELKGSIRLHDYMAYQTDAFSRGLRAGMQDDDALNSHCLAVNRQAFASGLMGRIQQHLLAALGVVTCDPRATH